ncbi:MAG: YcjF family protein [Candidatus Dormibacteraceae bacterium]
MVDQPNKPGTSEAGKTPAVTAAPRPDELTPEARAELASKLVDRFATWSGVAGLLPIPVVDLVAVGGLQLQMLRRLSQIYGVPFSDNRGKAVLSSLLGAMIPTATGLGAADALKAIPIIGTVISAFVTPALAAGATYAIGRVFIQHFGSGGTLLDFNPPDYREFLRGQKDMWVQRTKSNGSHDAPSSHASTSTEAPATGS